MSLSGPDYAVLFPVDGVGDSWRFTHAPRLSSTMTYVCSPTRPTVPTSAATIRTDVSVLDRLPQLSWTQELQWCR